MEKYNNNNLSKKIIIISPLDLYSEYLNQIHLVEMRRISLNVTIL